MSVLKQNDGSFPGFEERLTSLPGDSVVKNPPAIAGDARDWVQFLGWDDPLEQEMATHSNILAWKILWTEEPGGLLSMGSQRAEHD